MATQVQPEQPSENSPENSEQTTPPNSQTPPPVQNTTAPTNVNDLNLLAFRTAEKERQRLEEENRQLLQRLQSERKPEDYSSYNDRFLSEPAVATAEITRKIVQDEIRNAFAPLQQDFTQMRRESAYALLKSQVRAAFPRFSEIESLVDQIMAGAEPNMTNMQAAIPMAIGQLAMQGQWNSNGIAPTNNPTPNIPNNPMPAQLPPSPPAAPRAVNQNQTRPLSELEKRVARENGMTEEQYIQWRDMDEKQVATSNVGQPKP